MANTIVELETKSEDVMKLDEVFLAELEELAKDRYTDKDEDYMAVKTNPPADPPIIPSSSYPRVHYGRGSVGRGGQGNYHNNWRGGHRNSYRDNEYRNSNYYSDRNDRSRDRSDWNYSKGEKRRHED